MAAQVKQLIKRPSEQGDKKHAAFLKNRIYGTITLLAANVGLLIQTDITVRQAYIVIISTTIGIWLAGLLSVFLAHRIVHDRKADSPTILHELTVHRGMLFAALPSLIMVTLAALDIIEIQTALIIDVALSIVSLTLISIRSLSPQDNKILALFISLAIQALVAGVIILAKLSSK